MKTNLFISSLVLYVCVFVSKHTGAYLPEIINAYLSDILCLPIILSIARYGVAYWINDGRFSLRIAHIAVATVGTIIVFEIALPYSSSVYTADWLDAIIYVAGAIMYYLLQTPSVRPPWMWFHTN